jgi:hypothetical protein
MRRIVRIPAPSMVPVRRHPPAHHRIRNARAEDRPRARHRRARSARQRSTDRRHPATPAHSVCRSLIAQTVRPPSKARTARPVRNCPAGRRDNRHRASPSARTPASRNATPLGRRPAGCPRPTPERLGRRAVGDTGCPPATHHPRPEARRRAANSPVHRHRASRGATPRHPYGQTKTPLGHHPPCANKHRAASNQGPRHPARPGITKQHRHQQTKTPLGHHLP